MKDEKRGFQASSGSAAREISLMIIAVLLLSGIAAGRLAIDEGLTAWHGWQSGRIARAGGQ